MMFKQSDLTGACNAESMLTATVEPDTAPDAARSTRPLLSSDLPAESRVVRTKAGKDLAEEKSGTGRERQPGQTKIIATLGSGRPNAVALRGLMEAGVGVFRMTPESISHEDSLKSVYAIRSIATEMRREVALLLDLQSTAPRPSDGPAITASDWDQIGYGLEAGVDWFALPARGDAEGVRQLRQFLTGRKASQRGILARIDSESLPVGHNEIIEAADGIILDGSAPDGAPPDAVVIARQLLVAQVCARARKVSILAAESHEQLESAVAARPDALLPGRPAVSETTSIDDARKLQDLIRQEESKRTPEADGAGGVTGEKDEKIAGALRQAGETGSECVVVFTRHGNGAALCAALRQPRLSVFVFTPDSRLARRLCLLHALEPFVLRFGSGPKTALTTASKVVRERMRLAPGAQVVFITDPHDEGGSAGLVQVKPLG